MPLLAGTSGVFLTTLRFSLKQQLKRKEELVAPRVCGWYRYLGIILLSNLDSFVGTHIIPSQRYFKKKRISFSKDGIHLAKWNNILVGGFNPFEKYARQIGNLPQIGMKIKKNWNHHQYFTNLDAPEIPSKGPCTNSGRGPPWTAAGRSEVIKVSLMRWPNPGDLTFWGDWKWYKNQVKSICGNIWNIRYIILFVVVLL